MKIAFRTDASNLIGTGHVRRCVTLANALCLNGAECCFITRELNGHLADWIQDQGFSVTLLPAAKASPPAGPPDHAPWAEVDWVRDARETFAVLTDAPSDWLVMDHYAFDARWEQEARPEGTKLMIIDDLADRPHVANILLDQNLGRSASDYDRLVPPDCTRLIGPSFALLRPEFAACRAEVLAARATRIGNGVKHLLISMGGVDLPNATSAVLEALPGCALPKDMQISVVMGKTAPSLNRVRALTNALDWQADVHVETSDMADLIAKADLAIGAVGGSTWERCCVGLPTLMVTIAENQKSAARAMADAAAALNLGSVDASFARRLRCAITKVSNPTRLQEISDRAAVICDGDGLLRLLLNFFPSQHSFRTPQINDSRRIWEWRRTNGTLRFNRNSREPSFSDHHSWFAAAICDPERRFKIFEINDLPMGYLRLDRVNMHLARISICIDKTVRGTGLSQIFLRTANILATDMGVSQIEAEIHPENQTSLRAFGKAGYHESGTKEGFLIYHRKVEEIT